MRIDRRRYAELYGPTTGDRFRLADTNLVCEVERDLTVPGEEAIFGGGKTIRDGMAQSSGATNAGGALYGRARLETMLRDLAEASSAPATMTHALAADVSRFAAGAGPADDIAILVLRWKGPAAAARAT